MWANTTSISFSWICKIIMTATIFTFFKGFRCGEGRKSTNCWFCCKLMVEVVVFCANLLSLWKFPKRCWDLEQETCHRSNPHAYPIFPRDNICSKTDSHDPIHPFGSYFDFDLNFEFSIWACNLVVIEVEHHTTYTSRQWFFRSPFLFIHQNGQRRQACGQ